MNKILRAVRLALNACHNTITTDIPGTKPDDTHWRIDNSKEIAIIADLEEKLNNGTCLLCGHCSNLHENERSLGR